MLETSINGFGKVVFHTDPLPAASVSHMSSSSRPVCSTTDLSLFYLPTKAAKEGPSAWPTVSLWEIWKKLQGK